MKSQFWIHLVALFTLLILPNVGYYLPLCRTDQQQVYDNCFGKYAHPEDTDAAGEFYIGEFQDDEFIGLGGYFSQMEQTILVTSRVEKPVGLAHTITAVDEFT